jgi:hypothetical protein
MKSVISVVVGHASCFLSIARLVRNRLAGFRILRRNLASQNSTGSMVPKNTKFGSISGGTTCRDRPVIILQIVNLYHYVQLGLLHSKIDIIRGQLHNMDFLVVQNSSFTAGLRETGQSLFIISEFISLRTTCMAGFCLDNPVVEFV